MRVPSFKMTAAAAILATSAYPFASTSTFATPMQQSTATIAATPAAQQSPQAQDAASQGRDTFRALLFFQGAKGHSVLHTSQFSSLTEADKEKLYKVANTDAATSVVDQVMSEIDATDPTFFAKFQEAMQSGRPALVHNATADAINRLQSTAIYRQKAQSQDEAQTYIPDSAGNNCGVAVVVAAGAVIVVAAVAAVNLVVAANIAGGYNVAAGTNVAYQNNYTRTRSAMEQSPIGNPYAVELASLFKA